MLQGFTVLISCHDLSPRSFQFPLFVSENINYIIRHVTAIIRVTSESIAEKSTDCGRDISINRLSICTGPDLGLGKLGSCPGASTYVLSPFVFCYSRVVWASTAPLLKAVHGPPQPGDLHICIVTFFWYYRVAWASTAPLLKLPRGFHNQRASTYVLSPFIFGGILG